MNVCAVTSNGVGSGVNTEELYKGESLDLHNRGFSLVGKAWPSRETVLQRDETEGVSSREAPAVALLGDGLGVGGLEIGKQGPNDAV